MIVYMGRNVDNGTSQLGISASIFMQSQKIGITSHQSYVSSSSQISTTMSTTPSFLNTTNVSMASEVGLYNAYPLNRQVNLDFSKRQNRTTAFVTIQNVTYVFSHYSFYTKNYDNEYQKNVRYCYEPYYFDGKEYCREVITGDSVTLLQSVYEGTSFDGTDVNAEIQAINDTNDLQIKVGALPVEISMVLRSFLSSERMANLTSEDSGNGNLLQAVSFWTTDAAYSNAASVIDEVNNVLRIFPIALSVGPTVNNALALLNGFDRNASEGAVVAQTMSLVSDTVGLTPAVLSQLIVISFLPQFSSLQMSILDENLPQYANGCNYSIGEYESRSYITM